LCAGAHAVSFDLVGRAEAYFDQLDRPLVAAETKMHPLGSLFTNQVEGMIYTTGQFADRTSACSKHGDP
jgi:hypothetical protein